MYELCRKDPCIKKEYPRNMIISPILSFLPISFPAEELWKTGMKTPKIRVSFGSGRPLDGLRDENGKREQIMH